MPLIPSTTAWTWSRSRCSRERKAFRLGTVHSGPAHPPALAGPPRPLARRRGMALPVVVGGLPAADPGAADAGRRRPPQPAHARGDAGGRRPARRPVLPGRHAPLAGELAVARHPGPHTGGLAHIRETAVRRGRAGTRRVRVAVAARRQPAAARAGAGRRRRVARRPAGTPLLDALGTAAAGVRAARR